MVRFPEFTEADVSSLLNNRNSIFFFKLQNKFFSTDNLLLGLIVAAPRYFLN